jgi:hypothetical protein
MLPSPTHTHAPRTRSLIGAAAVWLLGGGVVLGLLLLVGCETLEQAAREGPRADPNAPLRDISDADPDYRPLRVRDRGELAPQSAVIDYRRRYMESLHRIDILQSENTRLRDRVATLEDRVAQLEGRRTMQADKAP